MRIPSRIVTEVKKTGGKAAIKATRPAIFEISSALPQNIVFSNGGIDSSARGINARVWLASCWGKL